MKRAYILISVFMAGVIAQWYVDKAEHKRNDAYFERDVHFDKDLKVCIAEQGMAKYLIDMTSDCMHDKGHSPLGQYGGPYR